MAKQQQKNEPARNSLSAPAGFTKVTGGTTWRFKEELTLQGTILSITRHTSTKFFDVIQHEDGTTEKRGKPQKRCTIVTADGEIKHVWESPGLKELFNQAIGSRVWIGYLGEKDVGQGQPMNEFEIAVAP